VYRVWVATNRYSITLIAFRGVQSCFDSAYGTFNNKLVFAQNDVGIKAYGVIFACFARSWNLASFVTEGSAVVSHIQTYQT